VIEQRTSVQVAEGMSQEQELSSYITALEQGQADIHILQRISLLCIENPAGELASPLLSPVFGPPSSPSPFLDSPRSLPSLRPELWTKDKNFERLFKALMKFLDPGKVCHLFYNFPYTDVQTLFRRMRMRLSMG